MMMRPSAFTPLIPKPASAPKLAPKLAANPDLDLAALAEQIFDDICVLSQDGSGVSRPAFSQTETETLEYLSNVARAHGLDVMTDALGNRVFSLPRDRGAKQWILLGSHVDTVPKGGNYDGLAGVVAGLLVLINAQISGTKLRQPAKCIALRGEESAWFGTCYLSSRGLLGKLDAGLLAAPHRGDGRPLADHMSALGIDTAPIKAGQLLCDPSSILAYIELHIEQGPLLVDQDKPAAIVTSIRGNLRHPLIRCIGEPGHSGAVPRPLRRDPVMATADLLNELDRVWDEKLSDNHDLAITSGVISTDPDRHAIARIADEVFFSLDIRSSDSAVLEDMRRFLNDRIATLERQRGVTFDKGHEILSDPARMDPAVTQALLTAMERIGLTQTAMPSGAGHDAAVFAQAGVPTGMVFVRNRNGSHNPHEHMDIADLMHGVRILDAFCSP